MKLLNSHYFSLSSNYFSKISDVNANDSHSHEFIEIFYVLSGSAYHTINGKREIIETGDLYILRKSDYHFFQRMNDQVFTHRDFLVKEENFERICSTLSPLFYQEVLSQSVIRLKLNQSQIDNLENLFSYAKLLSFSSIEKSDIALNFALVKLLNVFFEAQIDKSSIKRNENELIKNMLIILDRPMGLKYTATDILNEAHYDHAYLCKLFKSHTGMTITQYINKHRLEYANTLIKTSTLPLQEIAYMAGYNNYSYFYRAFSKHFKTSPQEARSKKENSSS